MYPLKIPNEQSERNRRSLAIRAMVEQKREQEMVSQDKAERMANLLNEAAAPTASDAEMGLRAAYAGNVLRRRQITRKAVRDFVGLLFILAVLGWLFIQWTAAGG